MAITVPKQQQETRKKTNKLRYAEYYNLQPVLDGLYVRSTEEKKFANLMSLITSEANVLLAYRSIKRNGGSLTPGTDGRTIQDIEKLEPAQVVETIRKRLTNYLPGQVRRKEIPKPNGKTRPLGIPCVWDRLIQQCILQILEPICEARFSDNSYGFRPLRSAENASAAEMKLINQSKLYFIVEIDIKSFFDEVNHKKLLRQLWTLGIQDKKLPAVIKSILKAPIRMPDNTVYYPAKGTPQGGILSPLLANVVLNELDQWVDSQWKNNPVTEKYSVRHHKNGSPNKGNGYRAMKKTRLKEMYIVRYADDVRVLCRTRSQADRTAIAVKRWLNERLKLQVSEEKTRVVNVKRHYSEFLGFKLKAVRKAGKWVVQSHVRDKALQSGKEKLKEQIKKIQRPKDKGDQASEICKYNAMARGLHNYYAMATQVSRDFAKVEWEISRVLKNRLGKALSKNGSIGKKSQDYLKYGKSDQTRFVGSAWILPVGYVQHRNPMCKRRNANLYTESGRTEAHDNLRIKNQWIMSHMAERPVRGRTVEYNDNRISLFAAQYGKRAITGEEFLSPDEVCRHHKKPLYMEGKDNYQNLTLVLKPVHILIHAKTEETIKYYLSMLNLNSEQKKKLNKLRQTAGCEPV